MIFDLIGGRYNSVGEAAITIAACIAAVFTALIAHEIAHGYAALWNGDDTAKRAGRLTPNPSAHLDLLGTIFLLVVGIGWAKPVPINPYNFKDIKKGVITTSLAGVAANLALALIFAGIYHLLQLTAVFWVVGTAGFWVYYAAIIFCLYFVHINLLIMLFNLIPVAPLDGFRVLEAVVKPDNGYVEFMNRNSRWLGLVVLVVIGYSGILTTAVEGLRGLLGM
ncbi:MAG: site-2 protease family protein [Clostridiales bacterium]|jgi:Zn-dependent protease|nr:site-2 protease family protein [Clostridiales bacterium]